MDAPISPVLPRWSQVRPRYGSAIVALLGVGLALGYAVSQETPRGRLAGVITRQDTGAPMPFARLTAYSNAKAFYTRADAKGHYAFAGLPVGAYDLNAYSRSRAFEVSSAKTSVDESQTTDLPLALKRTRPDLQLTQQEQVFLPTESVSLPLHGYVDPEKARNADVLRLRVWKTRLSDMMADENTAQALAQVGNRWQPPATLPTVLLQPASAPKPKLIEDRAVKITEADAEGFYHKRLPLATRGVGLYLTEISHREGEKTKTVCAWINVTGTALVTKRAGSQTLAYVTDLKSGAAKANFPVLFYSGGQKIGQTSTDSKGVALFSTPVSDAKLMAVAQRGDEEAVLSRDPGGEENAGKIVTHVYTDRPIYRPGQKISFKGVVRFRNGEFGVRNSSLPSQFRSPHSDFIPPASVPDFGLVNIEMRDPTGVQVLKTQKTLNNYGSFAGEVELSPEAPTGLYSLITTIDGEEHSTDITVSSYRKPEFEVTVAPEKPRYIASDGMRMNIEAKYYFGAPVAGAKVRFEIYRNPDWSADYERDAEGEDEDLEDDYGGYGEFIRDGEGILDENGRISVNFPARSTYEIENLQDEEPGAKTPDDPAAEQPQIYTAHVTVTDAAEREVEGEGKARLVAGDFGLSVQPGGYFAQPNQPFSLNIEARDYDGKPVANQNIDLEIGYWRYEERKTTNYDYEEPQKSNFVTVGTQKFTTNAQGVATGSIKVPRNGDFDLIARSTDRAGRLIRDSANIWAASDAGGEFYGGAPADLALFTDKKRYEAGQTARVLINSGKIGPSVLLTLEGERVYQSWVVPIKQASTVVRVPIKDEFGPNVYLAACYVKDKKFAQSEIPLRVHVAAREVKVAVRSDKIDYTPGAPVTYQVKTTDAKGRAVPAEFSFGVVDESIYALAEDHPEALGKEFYPRRQNRVQTAHSFATEYLGDANKAALHIEPRKKFLDTAFWQPFAQTGADGTAKITFNLPDNLTKWRATAIAQTQDTAFGFVTQKVTSSKDFYVRLEKPRFLTQRDNARLIAFVHNDTGAPQKATVRLELDGLTASDEMTQLLEIEAGKVGEITWPVLADAATEAKITLSAWTDSKKYSDAVEETLPLHPHGRTLLSGRAGQVSGEKIQTETVRLDNKSLPQASRVTLRLTPSVVSSLTGGLEYLIGFPYGCVEQTMSRFLPDILVSRVLKQSGDSAKSRELQAKLPTMVRDGLTRLYAMQHDSGAWGWWEIDADNAWMTAYVLYGLSAAREAGYAVDAEKFSRGRTAALQMLPTAKGQNRAFLLYSLARSAQSAEEKTKIFKERGKTNWNGWDGEALAYLLLTDKLLDFSDPKAKAAFERRAVSDDAMVHWKHWSDPKRDELWEHDYNDVTATAAGLRAVLSQNPSDSRVPQILRWLMQRRTGDHWNSTRDTSFVLASLCDYLEANPGAANVSGALNVRLNGQSVKTLTFTPQTGNEPDLQVEVSGSRLKSGDNKITLERTGGESPVFYSLQVRQILASEDIPALEQPKFKITREYLRLTTPDRSKKWEMSTEATNNVLKQGDAIRVKLTFEAPRDMAYVMIEDPFPAGCETTERGTADQSVDSDWRYGYSTIDVANIDVRDDRIAFFARKIAAGKHTIQYHLRAQTPGVYHVLPAQVSPMYDPSTRAETAETRVEVR